MPRSNYADRTIEGVTPAGSPPTGEYPVTVAGWDGTNVQRFKTDTAGNLTTYNFAPALSTYALTSVSGTATLTLFFVDSTGAQASGLQTYSITSATTLTALYNAANGINPSTTPLPSNFAGAKCVLSGAALYVGNGGTSTGTITTGQTPASGYPQIATSNYFTLGRV